MTVFDQIYNGCAMLPGLSMDVSGGAYVSDPMDRHKLRSSLYRIRVALGELPPSQTESDAAAEAYMAGYDK